MYLGRTNNNTFANNIIGGAPNEIVYQINGGSTGFISTPVSVDSTSHLIFNFQTNAFEWTDNLFHNSNKTIGASVEIWSNQNSNRFEIDAKTGKISAGIYGVNPAQDFSIAYYKDTAIDGSNGWWKGLDIYNILKSSSIEYVGCNISNSIDGNNTMNIPTWDGFRSEGPTFVNGPSNNIIIDNVNHFFARQDLSINPASLVIGFQSNIIPDGVNTAYNFYAGSNALNHFQGNTIFGSDVTVTGTITMTGAVSNPNDVATKAYVDALAFSGGSGSGSSSVISVNGQTGLVVLTANDIGAAGLISPTFTGFPTAPTATIGTNTSQIATTAFVQNAIDASLINSVTSVAGKTGNVTLTVADVFGAADASTYLPLSGGTLTGPLILSNAPTLNNHAVTKSYADGTGNNANGYHLFPGGMMIQGGIYLSLADNTTVTVNFPNSFPTACISIVASIEDFSNGGSYAQTVAAKVLSKSSFQLKSEYSSGATSPKNINWIAIGY